MFVLAELWFALSLLVAWGGTAVAVVRDARARIDNPSAAKAAGIVALALPVAGGLLWLCVRPAETIRGRRERRLVDAVCELDAAPVPQPFAVAPQAAPLRRAA